MVKSIIVLALSIIAVSSAQIASTPHRIRGGNAVTQQEGNSFGRIDDNNNNLRSNMLRDLQLSMSMPAGQDETPVPVGCMDDDECPEGSSCDCWLSCRFCLPEFAPYGTCKADL